MDNEPEYVRSTPTKKLSEVMESKLVEAFRVVERLKQKSGLCPDEIHEVAVETILAPSDGRAITQGSPPEPLSEQERMAVWRKQEALEIVDERLMEAQERKALPKLL